MCGSFCWKSLHFILEDVFFLKNWTAVSVFVTFFNGDRFKAFRAYITSNNSSQHGGMFNTKQPLLV